MTAPVSPSDRSRLALVATLGPASASAHSVAALGSAGANWVRLNASHLTEEGLGGYLGAALEAGFEPSRVIVDLQGGKARLGEIGTPIEALTGLTVRLVPASSPVDTEGPVLPVDRPEFVRALRPGDVVRVDDGRVSLAIENAEGVGWRATVRGEGWIRTRKGLALVGREVDTGPRLLPRDLDLLGCARARGVADFAVSYASAALVQETRSAASAAEDATRSPVRIHAKIEQPSTIAALEELIAVSDSLWFCRGDLGAEVGLEALPRAQRQVLDAAVGRVPLLVAGQVLHHMTVSPRPTRSEACHVADLVWRGVAGFVLSDETASGPHGAEAVSWLRRLVDSATGEP